MIKLSQFVKNKAEYTTLMGIFIIFVAFFPFGIYRYITGDYIMFAIDMWMSLLCAYYLFNAWCQRPNLHTQWLALGSVILAFLYGLAHKGPIFVHWGYSIFIMSFFLAPPTISLTINLIVILISSIFVYGKVSDIEFVIIYLNMLIVSIVTFSFSLRGDYHKKTLSLLATKDPLTGIDNRRAFDADIEITVRKFPKKKIPSALLIIDIDFFKKINDTYGHQKGDEILIEAAKVLSNCCRKKEDTLYRYGGEEFTLIAHNTNANEATKIVNRIQNKVAQSSELSAYNITMSLGISQLTSGDHAESWFNRTDMAMYKAKLEGRNRAIIAHTTEGGRTTTYQTLLA